MYGNSKKSHPEVGAVKSFNGRKMRYTGLDSKGAENWEGIAPKPKMGKVKMKPKTNYKSTGSKKGKPRKRKSLM